MRINYFYFDATLSEAAIEAALPADHTLIFPFEDDYRMRSVDSDEWIVRTYSGEGPDLSEIVIDK
jgi:hypothetical protein